FLIESVSSTIEVKSTLDQAGLVQAARAARRIKELPVNKSTAFAAGYIPPKPLAFLVAYDGPATMGTVFNWIETFHKDEKIFVDDLPLNAAARQSVPSPSLDGVFVLGKGFLYFDNVPFGFANEHRLQNPRMKWVYCDCKED